MMRTSLLVLLAGMALGAGCSDDREAPSSVRISPTVSRVTGLYFDKEDRIGLTISRTSGDYVTNRLMTYDGSVFTASGLKWYESTQETSTLTAYYPYSERGFPPHSVWRPTSGRAARRRICWELSHGRSGRAAHPSQWFSITSCRSSPWSWRTTVPRRSPQ